MKIARLRVERFIFALVAISLAALWAVVITFTLGERDFTLERAQNQLAATVITLADFNELATRFPDGNPVQSNDTRTAAMWRALLQYPAAGIWLEEDGVVTGGQAFDNLDNAIVVEEARQNFTVYAALPEAAALADWQRSATQRVSLLAVVSAALLVLTHFLVQAMNTLREHDALLSAVTSGAAELLGTHRLEDAIMAVLELIGNTVGVSRIHLNSLTRGANPYLRSWIAHEWHVPGLDPMIDELEFNDIAVHEHFPGSAELITDGRTAAFHANDIPDIYRRPYLDARMYSFLQIPVLVEDKLWGNISFIDAGKSRREWHWTETDTLKTLAGLIGESMGRARAEEKIATLARTDSLTGLANRASFLDRLRQNFAAARRGAAPFAILYLDLDHFKPINDTLGHAVGDVLLKEVANRLIASSRETDVVARLGGDEFAILQTQIKEADNAGTLAQSIVNQISRGYLIDGHELHVSCSVGICLYSAASESPDQMLIQADLALYRSKEEGRNRFRFHSNDLDQQVLARTELAEDLKAAIEQDELELLYKPQMALAQKDVVGMEALVRWNHPEKGPLEARELMAIAERSGAIMTLGHWMLEQACRQMQNWRRQGTDLEVLTINLSALQLKNARELISDIVNTTQQYGLKPSDFDLNVTEAMLAQTTLTRNNVLTSLRELGCKISIDNFGAEYSFFDYLRRYDVQQIKISRTLIAKALVDPDEALALRAITHLARDLGVNLVAEEIATPAQSRLLREMGKRGNGQDYYYSAAIDAAAASNVLKRQTGAAKLLESNKEKT